MLMWVLIRSETTRRRAIAETLKLRSIHFMSKSEHRRIPANGIEPGKLPLQRLHPRQPNQPERPLPKPSGKAPYHLALDSVLTPQQLEAIQQSGRMIFHIAGDTGEVKSPEPQQIVADHMAADFQNAAASAPPAFFYHVGDVVYYYGEASQYYSQFYEPYQKYPAPILAIPGNHDGDIATKSAISLAAFVQNFCAKKPHLTKEAGDVSRDAMTQPNVYWTLDTPYATIIGLYTNVPEGGWMDDQQIAWFTEELTSAAKDKALLVALHHPIYSLDMFHSGSQYMSEKLDNAIQQSGRWPDLVLTGHVHNYQRFTRSSAGRQVPYLVVGGGGYWHLHSMAKDAQGQPLPTPYPAQGSDITLESYCDDRHGYLLMEATSTEIRGSYYTVPRPQEAWSAPAQLLDSFTLNLQNHTL